MMTEHFANMERFAAKFGKPVPINQFKHEILLRGLNASLYELDDDPVTREALRATIQSIIGDTQ